MILEGPLNSLSIGNVTYNFAKELFNREILNGYFCVGNNFDFSAFSPGAKFKKALEEKFDSSLSNLNANDSVLKCWHISGSEKALTNKQYLYTFYEVDSPTPEEIAIVKRQKHVFFSSQEACDVFKQSGCGNVSYVPLGFDEELKNGRNATLKPIHFGLIGKFEARKNTKRIIKLWLDKYGNNNNYLLTCLVNNPFYDEKTYESVIRDTLGEKNWTNINLLPRMPKNSDVASVHQAIDIDLSGLSNGEGWNLPAFNSTCLGKWAVVTNCSGHKGWATKSNCILVDVEGKVPCYDNIFFREGNKYNQGSYYRVSDDAIIDGIERAVKLAKQPNVSGQETAKKFTYQNSMNKILDIINN